MQKIWGRMHLDRALSKSAAAEVKVQGKKNIFFCGYFLK
jgi:hypothetical protein